MRVRLWLGSGAIALSIVAVLAMPGSIAAATTASATTTINATAEITTTTCTDGHWPRSVQGVPTLFHAGGRAGDYIWHDANGWHLRVTHATSTRFVQRPSGL